MRENLENRPFSDELRRYIAVLWHWAWLLALVVVVSGGVAYLVSSRITPVYQATTTLLVNEAPATKFTDYSSVLTSERLAKTYTELLTTKPVLEDVIVRLGLETSLARLQETIEVELVRDTQLIIVRVENTSPQQSAEIANMIATVFSERNQELQASRYATSKESLSAQLIQMDEQINTTNDTLTEIGDDPERSEERDRLEATLAQYRQTYASLLQSYEEVRVAEASSISNVVQVEEASVPFEPIRPRTLINVLVASLIGLTFAVGVIYLIEALDDTLSPDAVSRQLGLPVLGVIARHQLTDGKPIVALEPRSPVAEAFRSLRTNIQFASVDHPLHTLLVTSPSPEDGKSTVAANLGISLAQSGRRVTVMDADLRRPQVHKNFALINRVGITSLFVQSHLQLDGALQETGYANLSALTSGNLPPNPAELLGSERMVEIMRLVGEQSDIIIIDSPPVMAVTDAAVLAPRVDGVLLVVKPGTTKLAACKQAVEQLHRVGANILGVILNDIEINRSGYKYAYYKGYYYTYHRYYGGDGETVAVKGR